MEYELLDYLQYCNRYNVTPSVYFRTPASQTPADVWMVSRNNHSEDSSEVYLYQCKTTRSLKPPHINKEEFADFADYCRDINARGYWVDRWKKNKNTYIRRIRKINPMFYWFHDDDEVEVMEFPKDMMFLTEKKDDFSDELKEAKKGRHP